MDEKITFHLRRAWQYLELLRQIAECPQAEFVKDQVIIAAAERYLQLAIESCLNIGNRILAGYQADRKFHPPETYADIFRALEQLNITSGLEHSLVQMAKFRNRLVHLYWEVDSSQLYDIIRNNLGDIEEFLRQIAKKLQAE